MAFVTRVVLVLAVILAGFADLSTGVRTRANPIRRVITMLQMMMKKSEDSAVLEEKLFDKAMCQFKKNQASLEASIKFCKERIPQLESTIQETLAVKSTLDNEIKQAKEDKGSAESSLKEAKAMRASDGKAFAKESTESKANIKSLGLALKALKEGMGKEDFMQTPAASFVQGLVVTGMPKKEYDREALSAFLQEGDQTEDSGEIIGIIAQMKEDMENDLKASQEAETAAQGQFEALNNAKTKQIAAARSAIDEKSVRLAGAKVQLVELKADLKDTTTRLNNDGETYGKSRAASQKRDLEYGVLKKQFATEKVALADTIKILADDQAMDAFKKTAVVGKDSASAATFLQVGSSSRWRKQQALQLLQDTSADHPDQPALQLLAKQVSSAARQGAHSKKGFEKIIALVDNMIVLLGKEAADDKMKKSMCKHGLEKNEDKKAILENGIKSKTAEVTNMKENLMLLNKDMEKLQADMAALDKTVKEATKQRKEENAAFTEMLSDTNQAVGILEVAKNRLKEFYPADLLQVSKSSSEQAPSFLQEGESDSEGEGAREEDDEYNFMHKSKKPGETGGKVVLTMITTIQQDLKNEFATAKKEEADSQADYEDLLADAKLKRESTARAMTEKEGAKAALQEERKKGLDRIAGLQTELKETIDVIADLHEECDWLMKNFEERKKLREGEVGALERAKATLSGADYKS